MAFPDLVGQKFSRLEVLAYYTDHSYRTNNVWLCLCDCGAIVPAIGYHLIHGTKKSCGCLRIDRRKERCDYLRANFPSEYNVWAGIKQRCLNQRNQAYKNYGGRGITIDERWMLFKYFISDMGARPSLNHTIDRVDNNGSYCKDNCRWSTKKEQSRNKRVNRWLTIGEETLCVMDWSIRSGIASHVLITRLNYNWPISKLFDPVRERRKGVL